jgi:hypothetical protein
VQIARRAVTESRIRKGAVLDWQSRLAPPWTRLSTRDSRLSGAGLTQYSRLTPLGRWAHGSLGVRHASERFDSPRVVRAATRQALPLLVLGLLANIAMRVLILAVAVLGGADAQTEATIALTVGGLLVIASGRYVVVTRRPRVA